MGKKVFANSMEIAHRSGDAIVTAAFPDVCLSTPSPPAGPIPVPYPDTSKASDLKNGTKTVKIGKKPAAKEDSIYKTSPLGNEAATRGLGASVLSHVITGATQFAAHSMDVELEGKFAARHLDLTTSNHASYPGGTPPFPNLSEMHRVALDRIAKNQCPCCGKEDCPAAFKDGEEPLSMKEAIGAQPGRANYNPKRAEELKMLRHVKKTSCTCNGKVFPSPPCDVYRAPDRERHDRIENHWNDVREDFVKWYQKTYQKTLQGSGHFLGLMLGTVSAAERGQMLAATKLPRAQRATNPAARKYENMSTEANKLARINHLTPKEFGGCPDNPDNLQPQQTLCAACQDIDQFMTDSW